MTALTSRSQSAPSIAFQTLRQSGLPHLTVPDRACPSEEQPRALSDSLTALHIAPHSSPNLARPRAPTPRLASQNSNVLHPLCPAPSWLPDQARTRGAMRSFNAKPCASRLPSRTWPYDTRRGAARRHMNALPVPNTAPSRAPVHGHASPYPRDSTSHRHTIRTMRPLRAPLLRLSQRNALRLETPSALRGSRA
jgi:hypothetical protein